MATELFFMPLVFAAGLTKPQSKVRHLIYTKVSLTFSVAYMLMIMETEIHLHLYLSVLNHINAEIIYTKNH